MKRAGVLSRRDSEYLNLARRGFLATLKGRRVTLVPVCFVNQGDKLYTAIDKKPKGERLARTSNISSNPRVAFMVDDYSEDWRQLSYLLIHGSAKLVSDPRELERARQLLVSKYPQYRWLKLGGSSVLALTVEEKKFWEFKRGAR